MSPDQQEGSASAGEADWLDRICPYLLSEDGTYRSTEPDPDHRCMAQDPPGTLPIAFQERYCLTERHVRCEMFKFARSQRAAALGGDEGNPDAQVRSARFRPSVRSVPLTLGPSRGASNDEARRRRPMGLVVAAVGAALILALVLLALALNGLGGGSGPDASPSQPPSATTAPTDAPPTARPTPPDTPTAVPSIVPSEAPAGGAILIEYEVQEDELLVKIAETFGTTRGRILAANDGMRPPMRERDPYTQPGDIILVPVSAEMSREDIEAQPGFVAYAE